jgi:hypothetical protein
MTEGRRDKRTDGGRTGRMQAAIYSGLVGGAVGMAFGPRLKHVFRRRPSSAFAGTPCSRLPAESGGDPVTEPGNERGRGGREREGEGRGDRPDDAERRPA